MELYKVISKDNKSINGGDFDWSYYLPKKNGNPGKWTPKINDISMCNNGYHLTKHWNMWVQSEDDRIFLAEEKNIKEWHYDKCVCKQVRLVREIYVKFDNKLNTGDYNTGNSNTGNWNTGNRNIGNRNAGDSNTGYRNTGDSNTGYRNTGNWNTGYRNTGYRNTGNSNTGNWNTGNWNTGNWNTGNWNTGSFNTKKPDYYELFNKKIEKNIYESINFPSYFYFVLDSNLSYQENWIESFKKSSNEEIKRTINLPNFDYKIFEKITGITKKMIDDRLED
jgi:hypothetical protein